MNIPLKAKILLVGKDGFVSNINMDSKNRGVLKGNCPVCGQSHPETRSTLLNGYYGIICPETGIFVQAIYY